MRIATLLCAVLAITACAPDETRLTGSPPDSAKTMQVHRASLERETANTTTTSTPQDGGHETIGMTDSVTIVVIEPEHRP